LPPNALTFVARPNVAFLKTLIAPFERPKNYTHNMDNRLVNEVTASPVPSLPRFGGLPSEPILLQALAFATPQAESQGFCEGLY
jgi:hypothetical protein